MADKRRYAKGAARREEIIATAHAMIAENGYHGTSLRGIGRQIGLEPAHILHYFPSREDLLREVIEEWDAGSLKAAGSDSAVDALEVFVAAMRHNLTIRGVLHLYLAFAAEAIEEGHPAHEFFQRRFADNVHELAETLHTGQASGQVHADIDPATTARRLVALSDGLQLQSLMDPAIDPVAHLEEAINSLFVSGTRSHIDRPAWTGRG